MKRKERNLLLLYIAIMAGLILLSRLYWIFGDDPIGLILVFFFLAPIISFVFSLLLGKTKTGLYLPLIAGLMTTLNYMCNSEYTFQWKPDVDTLTVFMVCFLPALGGTEIMRFLDSLKTHRDEDAE